MAGELTWTRITDFSAGLWTRDKFEMPPNGAQIMRDCFPGRSGGLEPWLTHTAVTHTGTAAGEFPIGLGFINGWTTSPYLMMTFNPPNSLRLWRAATFGSWTLTNTFAAAPAYANTTRTEFIPYTSSATTRYAVFQIRANAADDGVWYIGDGGAGLTKASPTWRVGALAVHQSRIVATDIDTVYWTDPGGLTFPSGNFLLMRPEYRNITLLAPFTPSDLIIGGDGPFYLVQGDLSDPAVRRMADTANPVFTNDDRWHSSFAYTPQGVAYGSEPGSGIYVTSDGSNPQKISDQLAIDWGWSSFGGMPRHQSDLRYADGFLVTGIAVGGASSSLIYDTTSGAWFTSSSLLSGQIGMVESKNLHWILSGSVQSRVLRLDGLNSSANFLRSPSYTWKSAPFREDRGRQIRIREVDISYRTGGQSGAGIVVTVGGVSVSSASLAANTSGVLRFAFNIYGQYLDVTVTATGGGSGSTQDPAPSIEEVAIAHQPGHLL